MSPSDTGSANPEAADCLRAISRFLTLVDELRTVEQERMQRIIDFDGEPPSSYSAALEKVKTILENLATFLSDSAGQPPHIGAPVINPHAKDILRYEKEQLDQIIARIEGAASPRENEGTKEKPNWFRKIIDHPKIKKWLPKGFNSANIILDSMAFVPGISFVSEFKKQIENLLPW